jgi:hypothetical protein
VSRASQSTRSAHPGTRWCGGTGFCGRCSARCRGTSACRSLSLRRALRHVRLHRPPPFAASVVLTLLPVLLWVPKVSCEDSEVLQAGGALCANRSSADSDAAGLSRALAMVVVLCADSDLGFDPALLEAPLPDFDDVDVDDDDMDPEDDVALLAHTGGVPTQPTCTPAAPVHVPSRAAAVVTAVSTPASAQQRYPSPRVLRWQRRPCHTGHP